MNLILSSHSNILLHIFGPLVRGHNMGRAHGFNELMVLCISHGFTLEEDWETTTNDGATGGPRRVPRPRDMLETE